MKNVLKRKIDLSRFRKFRIFLLNFTAVVILIYLLLFIFMIIFQDRFLYHPSNENFYDCDGFENYERKEFNGTRFYYKDLKFSDNVLIYYSGNSGRACDRSTLTNLYEGYQASTIFVEYTGYGGDGNKPSLDLLQQDVLNIVEFTKNYSKVYVVGESLGTSLASYHTYKTNVNVLLLLAPFYSTQSLGEQMFPFYPISFLAIENYDSANWIKNYKNRLIIIHGIEDKSIPYNQAVDLFYVSNTDDKHLFLLPNAKHNDLYRYMDTRRIIRYAFLNRTYSNRIEEIRYLSKK